MKGANVDAHLRFSLVAVAIGIFLTICAGTAGAAVDFDKFKEINEANRAAITSGSITAEQVDTENYIPEVLKAKAQEEERQLEAYKARLAKMRGMSEGERQMNIKAQESAMHYTKLLRDGKYSTARSFESDAMFDVKADKYLVDVRPADDQTKADRQYPYKSLLGKGSEIRYMYESENGLIIPARAPSPGDRRFAMYGGIVSADMLRNVTAASEPKESTLDGSPVILYELAFRRPGHELKLYVDPEAAYKYRRVEDIVDGKVVRVLEAGGYKSIDGIAFPSQYKDTSYYAESPETVKESVTITIQKARFNYAIDPKEFRIDFTSRARLFDTTSRVDFRVFEHGPVEVNEMSLGIDEVLKRAQAAEARERPKVTTRSRPADSQTRTSSSPAGTSTSSPASAREPGATLPANSPTPSSGWHWSPAAMYVLVGACLVGLVGAVVCGRRRRR